MGFKMKLPKRFRFPIRFKILVSLLLIITTVVSVITFTMASLFHEDKLAYVHDLTSEMAGHASSQTRALLVGYQERLQVFTRLLLEKEMAAAQKSKLLTQLFEDFQEFVAISLYVDKKELTTVYDSRTLEEAGLTKETLFQRRKKHPLPLDKIAAGNIYLTNSTVTPKLPTFTMAIDHPSVSDKDKRFVVAAVIRLDDLQSLVKRSKVFVTFVADTKGRLLAHSFEKKVIQRERVNWITLIKGLRGIHSHGTTKEFDQDGVVYVGGVSQIRMGDLIAGVQIPKSAAYLTARELLNRLLFIALGSLIVSALISLFGSQLITRPLDKLMSAARVLATGKFDIQVATSSRDEINDLTQSFNHMASELDTRERALRDAQAALVQSEKLAAFGQLGAGIAHEVKNPLAGILGLTQLSMRKVEDDSAIHKNLIVIEKETNRCTTIIQNLLKFARQEKVAFEATNLNEVAEDAMAIVEHQLEMHKVKVVKELDENLPNIDGNGNQIQQVLINLMINAQQAMDGNAGEVRVISHCPDDEHVEILIKDNGPGMPEDVQAKIFEPFFTTKEVGKGTGLGLSVSYGIVREHKGEIVVESAIDEGTTFRMTFPTRRLMTICPECNKSYPIRAKHIGLKNKCKNCGYIFAIQMPEQCDLN